MEGEKKWYLSTTIQGSIISFLALLVAYLQLDIDNATLTNLVLGVFGLIGVILTIYGRIKAKYVIKK